MDWIHSPAHWGPCRDACHLVRLSPPPPPLVRAQYVFLVATLMNSLGALLSPVFSYLDFSALICVRIVQGLGGVSTYI